MALRRRFPLTVAMVTVGAYLLALLGLSVDEGSSGVVVADHAVTATGGSSRVPPAWPRSVVTDLTVVPGSPHVVRASTDVEGNSHIRADPDVLRSP